MHLNGNFFEKLIFFNTVEAKFFFSRDTFNLIGYKYIPKVKVAKIIET